MAGPHPRKLARVARPVASKTSKPAKVQEKARAGSRNGVGREGLVEGTRTYTPNTLAKLASEVADWQARDLEPAKHKTPLRRPEFATDSGIPIPDVLSPAQRSKDTIEQIKYLISHGVTGLSTAFDMPALMGYDADHAMSRGEVGKEGVAVSSLRDFEILFEGIPLDQVTTSMTINASAIVALCMYIAVAQ